MNALPWDILNGAISHQSYNPEYCLGTETEPASLNTGTIACNRLRCHQPGDVQYALVRSPKSDLLLSEFCRHTLCTSSAQRINVSPAHIGSFGLSNVLLC